MIYTQKNNEANNYSSSQARGTLAKQLKKQRVIRRGIPILGKSRSKQSPMAPVHRTQGKPITSRAGSDYTCASHTEHAHRKQIGSIRFRASHTNHAHRKQRIFNLCITHRACPSQANKCNPLFCITHKACQSQERRILTLVHHTQSMPVAGK